MPASHIVAVQRKVAGRAKRDDELAPHAIDSASDQRVCHEDLDRPPDSCERGRSSLRRALEQMFDDSLEVAERLDRIDYLRQRTGRGLRTCRAATRASR